MWLDFCYNMVLVICIIFMIYRVSEVVLFLRRSKESLLGFNSIYISMRLYPLGMIALWGPVALYNIVLLFDSKLSNSHILNCLLLLGTQSGTIMAITFFSRTAEARRLWKSYLCDVADDEFNTTTTSFRESSCKLVSSDPSDAEAIIIAQEDKEDEEERASRASVFGVLPAPSVVERPSSDYVRFNDLPIKDNLAL